MRRRRIISAAADHGRAGLRLSCRRSRPTCRPDRRIDAYLAKHPDADRGYDIDHPQARDRGSDHSACSASRVRPILLTQRGFWLEVAEDEDAALVDYSAALKAQPDFAPALYARASLLRGARDDKLRERRQARRKRISTS